MHNRLKFKVGDKVIYRNIFEFYVPKIGVIAKIDRRRVRPYKIGKYGWYSQSDLRESIDHNDLMKKLIDK